jgi:hypothetical protein
VLRAPPARGPVTSRGGSPAGAAGALSALALPFSCFGSCGGAGAVELSAAQGSKTMLDNDFRLIGHKRGPDAVIPGLKGDITVATTVPRAHGRIESLADAKAALAASPTAPVTDTAINYDDPHDGWGSNGANDGGRNRIAGDKPFPNDTRSRMTPSTTTTTSP